MSNAATRYTVSHTSHGWALILNFADGSGELIDYYPTRSEANDTRDALKSLRAGR